MLNLDVRWCHVTAASNGEFVLRRASRDAAASTVIAHAVPIVVRYGTIVIDVLDDVPIHVRDGGIVLELMAMPSTALIPPAVVAVAVVNASIPAHLRGPIAGREDKRNAVKSPITGRPQ